MKTNNWKNKVRHSYADFFLFSPWQSLPCFSRVNMALRLDAPMVCGLMVHYHGHAVSVWRRAGSCSATAASALLCFPRRPSATWCYKFWVNILMVLWYRDLMVLGSNPPANRQFAFTVVISKVFLFFFYQTLHDSLFVVFLRSLETTKISKQIEIPWQHLRWTQRF